jgi:hypothetical protein
MAACAQNPKTSKRPMEASGASPGALELVATSPSGPKRSQGPTTPVPRRLWPAASELTDASQRPPSSSSCSAATGGSVSEGAESPCQLGPCQLWQDVPGDVMGTVVAQLAVGDVKAARLVCKEWHRAVSASCQLLQPRALQAQRLAGR